MPARQARSSVQASSGAKNVRNKHRKRNLDAFAIASHQVPEERRVKRSRLGEMVDDASTHKRRRMVEDEDGEEVSAEEDVPDRRSAQRRTAQSGGDVEYGSDSSGNEWTMGGLAEDDDDSDLDSEEAFGESDEERYEGFTFGGSSKTSGKKKSRQQSAFDDDSEEDEGDEIDDDFGDAGVDLATMLDDPADEETPGANGTTADDESGSDEDSEDDEDEDEESSASESEDDSGNDDDNDNEERYARLRDRLDALDGQAEASTSKSAQTVGALSVEDLLADLDPSAKKQFSAALKTRKKSEAPKTLTAPLPKRQQDRLDREVASKKAKEQLDRWQDTVIQNRRADFLSFPLKDPNAAEPLGKDKFVAEITPQNELEENIRKIMEDSGMVRNSDKNPDADADHTILQSEELGTNNMPVEEVLRRRAELRKARELLFREERKAKRIAKIKSKSYRRVHRKERERDAQREREEMEALGIVDEDDQERSDRKRAEARMSTKHRDSKWAKTLKATNRAVWDDDARDSVVDQARRQEELRRRIAGERVSDAEGDSDSELDDDSDSSEDNDLDERARTARKLDRLAGGSAPAQRGKGVQNMDFMRAAEERKRKQNAEDIATLRKEYGDADDSDAAVDDQGLGRAIFGPKGSAVKDALPSKRPVLEEGDLSDDDDDARGNDDEVAIVTEQPTSSKQQDRKTSFAKRGPLSSGPGVQEDDMAGESATTSSWLSAPQQKSKKDRRKEGDDETAIKMATQLSKSNSKRTASNATQNGTKTSLAKPQSQDQQAPSTDGWTVVPYNEARADQDGSDSDAELNMLTAREQKTDYHRRAFAGDDVQLVFAADKAAAEESEDEKEVSTHMPGWGSWTGDGLSKATKRANAAKKHNPLFKTKVAGVRREDRKDARNERVIISEKSDRKGKKYLAPVLPHGFERKDQYERTLALPLGPEWTTKETHQRGTRPRVVTERGKVIEAMERPQV